MNITQSRIREILRTLDDRAGDHTLLFEEMTLNRDAACAIRQLQQQIAATPPAPPQWKLVPLAITPEMLAAAREAHMPFGDLEFAIQCAICAAPALPTQPQNEAMR